LEVFHETKDKIGIKVKIIIILLSASLALFFLYQGQQMVAVGKDLFRPFTQTPLRIVRIYPKASRQFAAFVASPFPFFPNGDSEGPPRWGPTRGVQNIWESPESPGTGPKPPGTGGS